MIVAYYKNQKIMLNQKGGKVSAKVGGVTVATDHATAQDARAAAQAFIDELEGEAVQCNDGWRTANKIPVKGSVS
jgi:hypothetical protein